MPANLRRLKITKVDLCASGANPDADIVIFKSRDANDVQKRDIPAAHRHSMPRGSFAGPHESFPIEKPEDVKNAWDLAGHAANPDAVRRHIRSIANRKGVAFTAALPSTATVKKEDTTVPKFVKPEDIAKASPEEIKAYVDELEKALKLQEDELEKAKKVPPKKKADSDEKEPDADDVTKSMSAEVKKSFKALEERVQKSEELAKAADDRVKKAEEKVEKAQSEAEFVTFKKQVESDMPKIPGTVDEVAKMLQEAKHALTAPSFTVLEKALKAGSAAVAKAAEEVGSTRGEVIGSALEEIYKSADELVKKGDAKTRPEAIEKIAKSNPDLYSRYKDERKNR